MSFQRMDNSLPLGREKGGGGGGEKRGVRAERKKKTERREKKAGVFVPSFLYSRGVGRWTTDISEEDN